MIVRLNPTRSASRRRPAFTLVEVLVVVAIVVILASVGTIATLKFLDDAKVDNMRQTAAVLVNTAKAQEAKLIDVNFEQTGLTPLTPYLDKGDEGLLDPWGKPYQVKYIQIQSTTSTTPQFRLYVFTTHNDNGYEYGWPKEYEGQGGAGQKAP